jgi:very-short-patch-repair endonuclease
MSRPLFRFNIEELEQSFKEAGDVESLQTIHAELLHRNTPKAASLRSKVDAALKAGNFATKPSRQEQPNNKRPTGTDNSLGRTAQQPSAATKGKLSGLHPSQVSAQSGSHRNPLSDTHNKLLDLLSYLEHLAKLGEEPIFSLKEYPQFAFSEADLKAQLAITHDVFSEDSQAWLRIERLQRQDPPPAPGEIQDWIVVSRDPFRAPKLLEIVTRTMSQVDADELVRMGNASKADVLPSLKLRDGKPMVDVILRLDHEPIVKAAADNYINSAWTVWAEAEKPRRNSIAIYDKFFSVCQSLQAEGTEHPLELVWGVGVARWKIDNQDIDHPLIEQLVEIEVDTDTGVITVGPRSTAPQLALGPYYSLEIEGVDATLNFARDFFDKLPTDQEFSPFHHASFESVLRFAATHLDSSGRYHPDYVADVHDRSLPPSSSSLVMSDTWAIYARARSANFFIDDLERLRNAVASSDNLPGPARKLVDIPSSETTYIPTLVDITRASLGGPTTGSFPTSDADLASSDQEFFFPKPFNADQIAIVQRLQEADGVVVQGPPGTGKTHTIANIICHYLATGQKVLVTSKGEAALAVLRDHIPEGIRDLTISLLTSEREGLKQLEKAVGLLAGAATQMNPSRLERQILEGQQEILELKKRLASTDAELVSFADKHLRRIPSKSDPHGLLPIELARLVVSESDRHSWLPDVLGLDPKHDPRFNDAGVAELRRARRILGTDLRYLDATLPALADLPDGSRIIAVHEDIVNAERLQSLMTQQNLPRLCLTSAQAIERCEALLTSINEVISLFDITSELPWLKSFVARWQKTRPKDDDRDKVFEGLLVAVGEIRKKRSEMIAYAISCPKAIVEDEKLPLAVHRAAHGERPFGLIPFGKTQSRERFSAIRIEGRAPRSSEDWYKVERYVAWRAKLASVTVRWNATAVEYGLPLLEDQGESTARWLSEILDKVENARTTAEKHTHQIRQELPQLFPHGLDIELILTSREYASQAIDAIKANLAALRFESSRAFVNEHIQRMQGLTGPVSEELREFLSHDIGNPKVVAKQVSERWQELSRELGRVHGLKPNLECVRRVAGLIRESGAPKWADAVMVSAADGEDPWTPDCWSESWSWARYRSYLKEIDGRDRFRQLSVARLKYEKKIQRAFAEVIRLRTYLGLKRNISNQVEAALNMFMAALRHIGRGTGIRARRFRRDARSAMEKSYAAVPCWIMPTWRISESLPAALGSFDLVIIDEASQSDITALPALLRGKKVLVVGDDRQVSPTAAFVEEKKLLQLKHNYLKEQPFGPLMLPGFSLYELALATFPGKRIMLREHFRCVEPIIRFSFQFYEEPIIPVRIARSSERLTPPLIAVHVLHGCKDKRQINVPEAEGIVDEIERLVKDPVFAKRSIGVVSLLGAKQAQHIQARLLERIGEEAFLHHQITCGDSATFQGKERDIMFVSMVECPATRSTKTALLFEQRFNVALSRARDRMYLFHSVTEDMLKPEDLKARVLRHFKSPMPALNSEAKTLLDLCDSDFERDVLKRLLDLGYRVNPQVRVGPFSIDMVVEGEADRRLAIELDGDKYHTPDRWADDLARQRVMERVGWRFWRCWGSSFHLDPEACLADLISTLNELGIQPTNFELESSVYTEFRVISDTSRTEAEAASLPEELPVQVGDRVLVSFNDDPSRQHTIVISVNGTDAPLGIYSIDHATGKALAGRMVDEEVFIPMENGLRKATILGIQKPSGVHVA